MKQHTIKSVLAVSACREKCASLRRILSGPDWALHFARSFADAKAVLRASSIGVVICEGDLGDGHCWKDLLKEVQRMPFPPPFIVADPLADEALWAEVLNLGCYDLLMTPFAAEEVLRVVSMAWVPVSAGATPFTAPYAETLSPVENWHGLNAQAGRTTSDASTRGA